jgi:hypothetical protein
MAASEVPDVPAPAPAPVATTAPASPQLRPAPVPVPVDARRIVAIGTALWIVAFLALLPFVGWLRSHDHLLWLWTCLCGTGLGLVGLVLIRKHRGEGRAA